jgi:hypothetical protein
MGKHDQTSKKHDAPLLDTKMAPPTSSWNMPSSIAELVDQTNLGSSGVKEVLSSATPQEAIVQTITHPVILAVVVGGALLLMSRRR